MGWTAWGKEWLDCICMQINRQECMSKYMEEYEKRIWICFGAWVQESHEWNMNAHVCNQNVDSVHISMWMKYGEHTRTEGQRQGHRWYAPQKHRERENDRRVIEKGEYMSAYLANAACDVVCFRIVRIKEEMSVYGWDTRSKNVETGEEESILTLSEWVLGFYVWWAKYGTYISLSLTESHEIRTR